MKNTNRIVLIQTVAAMCLLAGRYLFVVQHHSGYAALTSFPGPGSKTLLFLGWNLFLAFVPYALTLLFPFLRYRLVGGVILATWLLFLPNAPYLITDLIHLRPRAPVPLLADVLVFFFFAWTGLLLGLISMLNVRRYLSQWYTNRQLHGWMALFVLLSSFGLFLGRVERWNSWEAFTHPILLLQQSLVLLSNPTVMLISFLVFFSLLQGLGYLLLQRLSSTHSTSTFQNINS